MLDRFYSLTRICPYCDYQTHTVIPNIRIPFTTRLPAISWCSAKLGFHIERNHTIKSRKIWTEGDILEVVRFAHAQPDLQFKDRFKGMEPEEIAMEIHEGEEVDTFLHG